jgi:hypothetical protein
MPVIARSPSFLPRRVIRRRHGSKMAVGRGRIKESPRAYRMVGRRSPANPGEMGQEQPGAVGTWGGGACFPVPASVGPALDAAVQAGHHRSDRFRQLDYTERPNCLRRNAVSVWPVISTTGVFRLAATSATRMPELSCSRTSIRARSNYRLTSSATPASAEAALYTAAETGVTQAFPYQVGDHVLVIDEGSDRHHRSAQTRRCLTGTRRLRVRACRCLSVLCK